MVREPDDDGAPDEAPRDARRARNVERQRRDILEAAARAFLRSGYAATTMRAIAQEAGFTASSLYTYFQNKEAIFAALMALVADDVLEAFAAPLPRGISFAQRLELVILHQLDMVERNRELFAVMCSQGVFEASHASEIRQGAMRYIETLAKWLEENSDGALGSVSPEEAAYFLWGVQQGFFLRWLRNPSQPLGGSVPLVCRLFLQGVS
ncbi:MAG: TetR/AcrR family transcriptional regulator [Deltaproteobacteria bacterium]|nr:TetR/AcrR family transcriptional regulator [Deltaproteobacteria bacterium]